MKRFKLWILRWLGITAFSSRITCLEMESAAALETAIGHGRTIRNLERMIPLILDEQSRVNSELITHAIRLQALSDEITRDKRAIRAMDTHEERLRSHFEELKGIAKTLIDLDRRVTDAHARCGGLEKYTGTGAWAT